jgi:hypothetical protein
MTQAALVGGGAEAEVGVGGTWAGVSAIGGDLTVRAHARDAIQSVLARQRSVRDSDGLHTAGGNILGERLRTGQGLPSILADNVIRMTDAIVGVQPGPNGQFGDADDVYDRTGVLSRLIADELHGSGDPGNPTLVLATRFGRIAADVAFGDDLRIIENGVPVTIV